MSWTSPLPTSWASARNSRPYRRSRLPAQGGRVARGDQMTGIDQSAVGRMWSSTDLFASGGRRGHACPGRAQPDFDSGALFARGDTGACLSLLALGVEVHVVLEVPVERDDDDRVVAPDAPRPGPAPAAPSPANQYGRVRRSEEKSTTPRSQASASPQPSSASA